MLLLCDVRYVLCYTSPALVCTIQILSLLILVLLSLPLLLGAPMLRDCTAVARGVAVKVRFLLGCALGSECAGLGG
jgi:hypothetical protein